MGGCGSSPVDAEAAKRDKEISRAMRADGKAFQAEIRLLLLGAGESGKSTIAKQMKIIHNNGFTEAELMNYKPLIFQNAFQGMVTLLKAAEELGHKLENKKNRALVKNFLDADSEYFTGEVNKAIAKDMASLWKDPGIQAAYEKRNQFQLSDAVPYYLEHITRLGEDGYIPTEQDVLRSRAKTTGIIETKFEIDGNQFLLVDVGGQRSERKKWMNCFQDVTAVMFCVALSEYDLKLEEDGDTNRMHESLSLFDQICNSKWFDNTSMILFLNKKDLFAEKLEHSPLTIAFDDYDGPSNDWEAAAKWIGERFQAQNKSKTKQVYVQITCATDTGNVRFVFNTVKDIILNQAMDASGLNI